MKIVSIADTHGFHHHVNVPDGDILLHAGDLTMSGEIDVLKDVNKWFGKLPHSYKIVIAGNHDLSLGKDKSLGYKIFGHIHEGYGILKKKDTTFINCSVVNEHYNLVNEPVVINL